MSAGSLVVVGDTLLDTDIDGHTHRLCPDAPAPVVDVRGHASRPGGAGLAALLAHQQGAVVTLLTGWGEDDAGLTLANRLRDRVRVVGLPFGGSTVCKTRVRAADRSLVRLDSGQGTVLDDPIGAEAREALRAADAVLVADYGRGTSRNQALRAALQALPEDVPLVWDPHPRGAEPVMRTDLVTPNRFEAAAFLGQAPSDNAADMATDLVKLWGCRSVAVTLGADGAVLSRGDPSGTSTTRPPAGMGGVVDLCGAGDGFAAAATVALLRGASCAEAVVAAVTAASRFVTSTDMQQWTPARGAPKSEVGELPDAIELVARVRARHGRVVATGGCFDLLHPGHVRLLERARAMGDALVVCLNSDASVRKRKGPNRPVLSVTDRICLLSALSSVDAVVVFDENDPSAVLRQLRPDVWVKGGDYDGVALPEAEVVRRYGGRTELIPFEDGFSTSRLVDSLRPATEGEGGA